MYAAEVREYIFDHKENHGESIGFIASTLGISWEDTYNLFTYERALQDGSLKILKPGKSQNRNKIITLKDLLQTGLSVKNSSGFRAQIESDVERRLIST